MSDKNERTLPKTNMVSRTANYRSDDNMKERRLDILSSIKDVKDNLMNSLGGMTFDASSENSDVRETITTAGASSETASTNEIDNGDLSRNDQCSLKKDIVSGQEPLDYLGQSLKETPRKDKNFNNESSREENVKGAKHPKDTSGTPGSSPRERARKGLTSPISSKENGHRRIASSTDKAHKRRSSPMTAESSRKRPVLPENEVSSSKESQIETDTSRDSKDDKSKDSTRNSNLTSLKCVIDFKTTNGNVKKGDGQHSRPWSRTVRSVGSSGSFKSNSSYHMQRGRGVRGRGFRGRGTRGYGITRERAHTGRTVYYNKNRDNQEIKQSTRSPNSSEYVILKYLVKSSTKALFDEPENV